MIKEILVNKGGINAILTRGLNQYKELWLTVSGILLLFAMSQIAIPLQPVPITMQTVAVILIGLTYQRATAVKAVAGYLLLGAAGAPLFANFHGGYAILLGPTGGYLFAFLGCVWLMTSVRDLFRLDYQRFWPALLGSALGITVIFALGTLWLSSFTGWKMALQGGLYPFILPGIAKIVFLTATLHLIHHLTLWGRGKK